MLSRDITIGMKVVPISKSIGQDFETWKLLWMRGSKFLVIGRWNKSGKCWIAYSEIGNNAGNFLAKDLVEYQE